VALQRFENGLDLWGLNASTAEIGNDILFVPHSLRYLIEFDCKTAQPRFPGLPFAQLKEGHTGARPPLADNLHSACSRTIFESPTLTSFYVSMPPIDEAL
jgi:hypothetical protein